MSMIETKNITFTYANTNEKVLNDVSLEINKGECILLCGKSGCGKTTFTRLLNGLIPSFFDGELGGICNVLNLSSESATIEDYVRLVGSVFQNPKTQYFNSNTTDELSFPCENIGLDSKEIQDRIDQFASLYHIEKFLDKNLFYLSGGEKQKIAFAAACMLYPKVLVLDEPTSNLDDKAILELHDMIAKIKEQGVTVVIAEHRIAWITDLVDRYYYFEHGQVIHTYSKNEFLSLTDEEILNLGLRSKDLSKYTKLLQNKYQNKTTHEPFVELASVEIGYDAKHVIKKLPEISLGKSEIIGLMGHNGIGKSTLAKTLSGLMKQVKGKILIDGKETTLKDRINHTFLVMQDVNYELFSDSVKEEIQLGVDNLNRYEEIVEMLGLKEIEDKHPMSLSGGQKQRVVVAASMLSSKELIILDEPTSGLDRTNMDKVGKLLQDLKNQGKTILVITHDVELASLWCDRIINLEEQ